MRTINVLYKSLDLLRMKKNNGDIRVRRSSQDNCNSGTRNFGFHHGRDIFCLLWYLLFHENRYVIICLMMCNFVKIKENKVAFINGKPGKDWFDGFKRRHPDLIIRNQRNLRRQSENGESCCIERLFHWFEWNAGLTWYIKQPTVIWNCDETGKQFEYDPVKILALKGARSYYRK